MSHPDTNALARKVPQLLQIARLCYQQNNLDNKAKALDHAGRLALHVLDHHEQKKLSQADIDKLMVQVRNHLKNPDSQKEEQKALKRLLQNTLHKKTYLQTPFTTTEARDILEGWYASKDPLAKLLRINYSCSYRNRDNLIWHSIIRYALSGAAMHCASHTITILYNLLARRDYDQASNFTLLFILSNTLYAYAENSLILGLVTLIISECFLFIHHRHIHQKPHWGLVAQSVALLISFMLLQVQPVMALCKNQLQWLCGGALLLSWQILPLLSSECEHLLDRHGFNDYLTIDKDIQNNQQHPVSVKGR